MFSTISYFRMRSDIAVTVRLDSFGLKFKMSFAIMLLFLCFSEFISATHLSAQKKDSEQMTSKTLSLSMPSIIWSK